MDYGCGFLTAVHNFCCDLLFVETVYGKSYMQPSTRYFLVAIARAVHTMFYVQ